MANEKGNENEKNKNNNNNQKGVIILGVYIDCEGCANSVSRHLRCFEGVEKIEIDAKNNKIIVKGNKVDPVKMAKRLRKKTGKYVELISPIPEIDNKQNEKKQPEKPKITEVVLKVYLHCEGCVKEVKCALHKMHGVQTVELDMGKNIVTVNGTMDPYKLVEFIRKKIGKHAEIVKSEQKKQNNDNHNNHNHNKNAKNSGIYPKYPLELVLAPQLFSDENPNACSIL